MDVVGLDFFHPDTISSLEDVVQAIGRGLVRTHQTEIAFFGVQPHDVAQIRAHYARRLSLRSPGIWDPDGVDPEIWKAQFASEQAAIRVRIGTHPPSPGRG